ncbi:MAG TPA: sulfatase-like hydrolase/transferase [Planctomycetota bacterium]|nr:sulfatase-like hydrolase/transferase [Planctomycetota bacterium]
MKRPNVLLLHTDQQRWDTLCAAGFDWMVTPNLDALAARGTLFENAFTNNPVCMPSRHSMITGQYPSAMGTTCNGIELPQDAKTLHSLLRAQGYHTGALGKLHYLNHANRDYSKPHPGYGFDTLINSDEPGCYDDAYIAWVRERDPAQVENCRCSTPPAWKGTPVVKHGRNTHEPYVFEGPEDMTHSAFVADITCDTIRRHRDEPFFAFAGFYAPHCPLNPPKRFVDMYDPAKLPSPAMNDGENKLGLSDDEWRVVRQYYYALVSHVDDQVGRILATLDECGLADDTLVIFTSDHGEHLGDHGLVQKGTPGYDSCVRVPLIVSFPGKVPAGEKRGELIELVDLAPTIFDYVGVEVPGFFQGRSFRPLLDGRDYAERSSVFIEHRFPFGESWKVVRTRAFKYCVSGDGEEMLFDLWRDPNELTNVAGSCQYQVILDDMRTELIRRWFDVESQYPLRTGDY